MRFALTSEAGLNDGAAFPFAYLAIAVALSQASGDSERLAISFFGIRGLDSFYGGGFLIGPFDRMSQISGHGYVFIGQKAVAETESDWEKTAKVFPSAIREEGDIAQIGAIEVRFGNAAIAASGRTISPS